MRVGAVVCSLSLSPLAVSVCCLCDDETDIIISRLYYLIFIYHVPPYLLPSSCSSVVRSLISASCD